jgi:mRNA interferase MazF
MIEVYGIPPIVRRGEVWRVNFNPARGSEIQKQRPAVIISSDALLLHPVRLVVPLTGWAKTYENRVWIVPVEASLQNGLEKKSAADTAQTRAMTISTQRFIERIGLLEPDILEEVILGLGALVEFPNL